jgi:hypothetical protein
MKKLKLDLDRLAVDSFSTHLPPLDAGTVKAYDAPTPPYESCGCTTGGSYLAVFCPPPSTRTTCAVLMPE